MSTYQYFSEVVMGGFQDLCYLGYVALNAHKPKLRPPTLSMFMTLVFFIFKCFMVCLPWCVPVSPLHLYTETLIYSRFFKVINIRLGCP